MGKHLKSPSHICESFQMWCLIIVLSYSTKVSSFLDHRHGKGLSMPQKLYEMCSPDKMPGWLNHSSNTWGTSEASCKDVWLSRLLKWFITTSGRACQWSLCPVRQPAWSGLGQRWEGCTDLPLRFPSLWEIMLLGLILTQSLEYIYVPCNLELCKKKKFILSKKCSPAALRWSP